MNILPLTNCYVYLINGLGMREVLFSASWGECAIVVDGETIEEFTMKCIRGQEEIGFKFNSPEVKEIYNKEYRDNGIMYLEKIKEIKEYIEEVDKFNAEQTKKEEKKKKEIKKQEKVQRNVQKRENRGKDIHINSIMSEDMWDRLYEGVESLHGYTANYLQKNKGLNHKNVREEKNAIEVAPGLYIAHNDIIEVFKDGLKKS